MSRIYIHVCTMLTISNILWPTGMILYPLEKLRGLHLPGSSSTSHPLPVCYCYLEYTGSLVLRPIPSFSVLHAEKQELGTGLGTRLQCIYTTVAHCSHWNVL